MKVLGSVGRFVAIASTPLGSAHTVWERVVVVAAIIGLSLDLPDSAKTWWAGNHWLLLAWVVAGLLFWAGLRLQREKDDAFSPRIEYVTCETGQLGRFITRERGLDEEGHLVSENQRELLEGQPHAAMVIVENRSTRHADKSAVIDAVIQLVVYDPATAEAIWQRAKGFWTDNHQPPGISYGMSIDDLARRTLAPNGESHAIQVALKLSDDEVLGWDVFASQNMTPRQMDERRLPQTASGEWWVRLHVTGLETAPWTMGFVLSNLSDGTLALRPAIPEEAVQFVR